MIRLLCIILTIILPSCLMAQGDAETKTAKRFLMGIGSANVMDTYLSPYSYKHNDIRIDLIYESSRFKKWYDGAGLHLATMENPARNVREYDIGLYVQSSYYLLQKSMGAFCVKAGPMGYLYVGGLYNERNGNNPAQARLSLMADLAAVATYDFSLWNKNFQLEYSLDIPFVGVAYSPQFGQSYYEQFMLSDYDHNCIFAHFVNTPSIRHRLLLNFPFFDKRWFVGYNGVMDQSKYNGLRYHSYSHQFIIGWKL
ncbi:MAG: DUF3316 domain-containing protein [Bacteroidaceae bacterium]|nr:DUF3316 domain-containing protein [Bacteroidaceae bacterium]